MAEPLSEIKEVMDRMDRTGAVMSLRLTAADLAIIDAIIEKRRESLAFGVNVSRAGVIRDLIRAAGAGQSGKAEEI